MPEPRFTIVVGSGGVGKTTVAAALGLRQAQAGHDTLVMTFDPSWRLKDALGVDEMAREREVEVPIEVPGRLSASLLDPGATFDRIVERYAPDPDAMRRILDNRFYRDLSGGLGGILEFMAVERLWEVADGSEWQRVVLDTPPTRNAIDFLEAPKRIMEFLDSGAIRMALRPWFDSEGKISALKRLGPLGKVIEKRLDEALGMDFLRDMAEFFQIFGPLYEGFRERAGAVDELLKSEQVRFVLVSGPGEDAVPDTLFFARKLSECDLRLDHFVVNRVHPRVDAMAGAAGPGYELMSFLGEHDASGLEHLRSLIAGAPLATLPVFAQPPGSLEMLDLVSQSLAEQGF